ncbi:MAG TPA: PadR family transcriptional regulator [Thermoplasmata archaeon]|nr:PadR family transcriptional regulator [Thermoplasmata archaeon]
MRSSRSFLEQLRRDLRHGVLPVWILEALAEGPTYGYELLERLRKLHGTGFRVNPSVLYPALARLRTRGLVRSFHGTQSRGPVRKYYELTPAGRAMAPEAREMAMWARRELDVTPPTTESRPRPSAAARSA